MNKRFFKKCYFFLSSFVIFLIHLPFVFSKNKPSSQSLKENVASADGAYNSFVSERKAEAIYDSLKLGTLGLSWQACYYAVIGSRYLNSTGKLSNSNIISIVDFSLPSNKKRLFVIDLKNYKMLFNTYVAHGQNSGLEYAKKFSNSPESFQSSPGFYVTKESYIGSKGYALRLEGEENGINDNALSRGIVMHAAPYVNESLARTRGYIGRSWGCPAITPELTKPIIDKIRNGTCLFLYSPEKNYISRSGILRNSA